MPPHTPDTAATAPSSGAASPSSPADRQVRTRRRWPRRVALLVLTPLAIIAAMNAWVLAGARGRLHRPSDEALPRVSVALVLGTSPRRADGSPNLHFQRRMDAAAALFAAGKADIVLVSGAKAGRYYNEPRDMRAELVARGVPDSAIVSDEKGVRTFDSVVRVQEEFHALDCAIVSDAWHVPRALFIADRMGIKAVGVNAEPVPVHLSLKARSREWLARVLVVLDIYVLNTRPEHPPSGHGPDLSRRPPR
jgi:SanA protein